MVLPNSFFFRFFTLCLICVPWVKIMYSNEVEKYPISGLATANMIGVAISMFNFFLLGKMLEENPMIYYYIYKVFNCILEVARSHAAFVGVLLHIIITALISVILFDLIFETIFMIKSVSPSEEAISLSKRHKIIVVAILEAVSVFHPYFLTRIVNGLYKIEKVKEIDRVYKLEAKYKDYLKDLKASGKYEAFVPPKIEETPIMRPRHARKNLRKHHS
ncbi:unnamed protein product [Caenorhabditis bovis]|uniref:Uncharacterized protein n=1 Tax=Caenorhabditis bovis TaxID=2654633 RepID=A0A8S1ED14_9PELO|nr:unnamed protein product [Caenorhabditis bovis]